jgi:23S rRNA pseudouridine1911/1915/1917 synthase
MSDEGRAGVSAIVRVVAASEAGATILALAEAQAGALGRLAVERGGAWLDGRRVADPAEVALVGASLALRLPPGGVYAELELTPADIAYEDEWLVALHKRAGWYVGATPWDLCGNALAALGRYLAARDGAAPRLHLAHQLDRDTTGVLLLSRAPAANAPLQAAFAGGRVAKRYLALCAGVPAWAAHELRTGHGRSAGGRWRVYPPAELGRELPEGGGRVKLAHTTFAVEARLADAALVRAAPQTGRTHQIRLHLAHLGHPLLGDVRYGGPATYAGRELPGHLLHAAELRLRHPVTGAALELHSPPPPLFAELCREA